MKPIPVTLLALALLATAGCADLEQAVRGPEDPPARIEVFRGDQKPSKASRELGLLTDDGSLAEQGDIEAKMLNKARRMHADAVVFQAPLKSGRELQGLRWVETYVYRATVLGYDR